jgi:hypothetical protein
MRLLAFLCLLAIAITADAEVYRWVDAKGTVNYSNEPPPSGVKSSKVNIDAQAGPPSADTAECPTVR